MNIDGEGPENEIKPYEAKELSAEHLRLEDFEPEEETHLRDYLGVILRRKWVVITFALCVIVTVTASTFMMRPLYKATAVIRINIGNPDPITLKDDPGIRLEDNYYETQYNILKSRALAKRTIQSLMLYEDPDFNPGAGKSLFATLKGWLANLVPALGSVGGYGRPAKAPTEKEYTSLVNKFLSMVQIMPEKKTQLVRVSFISPFPELAQKTVNGLADSYIDFNIDNRLDASKKTGAVLQKQINLFKAKVEASEAALDDYASKNGMLIVDSKDNKQNIMIEKLAAISQALNAATTKRLQAEALHTELGRPGIDSPVLINNALIQDLRKQYASLQAQYSNLLNIYKPEYPKMQMLKSQMRAISRSIAHEKRQVIGSVASDYQTDLRDENYLSQEYAKQEGRILTYQKSNSQYQILKGDVDANRALYGTLLDRMKQVTAAATRTDTNIQVLDRAELPTAPYKPNKQENIALSMLFGLAGGIGLAFFIEYFDNTFKNTHEIEKTTRLPALGMIPMQKFPAVVKRPLIAYSQSRSPVAEAFRSIGTFIMLSSSAKPPKTILVTSPGEKEGKTTICINTAMALAESTGNGVIIDADLRKPKLHHSFGTDNAVGLSTFLSGNAEFEEGLIQKTQINGLNIITSGPIAPNPSELVVSRRMKDLLEALYTMYDFVIIDSPPLMGMSDSIYLSRIVDGSVIVIKAGETTKQVLSETKKIYRNINAKILGVVLNGIKENDLKYNYYSNYYSSYFKE